LRKVILHSIPSRGYRLTSAGRQLLATMDSTAQAYSLLSLHLSHRIQQLINLLTSSLSHDSRNPSSAKRYSQLLIRLGEDDLARSTYLSSRATYLKQKIRAMQHPGAYGASEVNSFVEAIAWIVVRVIKNSWGVYNEVLGDSRTASSFFEWCKEQVEGIP
jgi:exocyst complex component 8